jgi:two-component system, NtrC family, sensor kinase
VLQSVAFEKPSTIATPLAPRAAEGVLPEDAGRLARLAALALALTPLVDAARVLETAGEHLSTFLPGGRGYLLVWRLEPRRLEYQVLVGLPVPTQIPGAAPPPARGLCALVLADRMPRVASAPATLRGSLAPWEVTLAAETGAAALLAAPLKLGEGMSGVMLLSTAVEAGVDDVRLMAATAEAVGGALERALAFGSAQHEKLAGMGRLTAAIAHEVNNPLQAISNSLHLLLNRSMPEEKRARYLTMAHKEAEQLIGMVRRILDFSRPERDGMRPVAVQAALEAVLAIAAEQLQSRDITVVCEWAGGLPRVSGVASHVKQAFLNLVLAAADAMPDGGVLTVRTQLASSRSGAGGEIVVIEICDTGECVPDAELRAIFEPFSRTRRDSSGVGLPLSYSIIEQHGGRLSASSAESGTVFRVELPALRMPH